MDIDEAFKSGQVAAASDEQLAELLNRLCDMTTDNTRIHPRLIVRALTINHMQMARAIRQVEGTLERLNRERGKIGGENRCQFIFSGLTNGCSGPAARAAEPRR